MNIYTPKYGWARGAARASAPAGLLLVLLLLATPASVFAHAKFLRSRPSSGATLDSPPRLVELWFSAEVSQGFSSVEVTDSGGRRVDRGEVTFAEGGRKAQVELGELSAGVYNVVWRVVSKDEHTIRGKFTFKVTAPATPAPAPEGATQSPPPPQGPAAGAEPGPIAPPAAQGGGPPDAASAGESTITWLDNLVRWLAYVAMMTLFGGFATRLLVLGPALGGARGKSGRPDADALGVGALRVVRLLRAGAVVLLPALLAALALQSSSMHGVGLAEALSPARLGAVVTQTGFGTTWLVTTLAAAAVAVIAFLLGRPAGGATAGRKGLWWAGLFSSAVMFVGPSLTGHARAAAGQHHFAVVSDWLHLAAGGFWVGGLFHLALSVPAALARLGGAERGRAVGRVISRFRRMAVPSVAVVALAGLYSSWIHLGSLGALWGTPYGRTLLVKLLLVAPMLLLGAVNGFRYGPRAGAGREGAQGVAERGFLRSVRFEAALGVLVLLAAAVLVFVTPGRNDALEAGPGARAERQQGGK